MMNDLLKNGTSIGTLPPAVRAILVAEAFLSGKKTVIWLVENADEMFKSAEDLSCFIGEEPIQCFYPPDVRPYQGDSPSKEVTARRMAVLRRLIAERPQIVIAPLEAILPYTIARQDFTEAVVQIHAGAELNRDELAARLIRMGYTREPLIDDVGQFSIRGFVMDIFTPGMDDPVRIDLFGDTIDEIRTFTLATQRSKRQLDTLEILPISEILLFVSHIKRARPKLRRLKGKALPVMIQDLEQGILTPGLEAFLPLFYEKPATLFDYLPRDYILVSPDQYALADAWEQVHAQYSKAHSKVDWAIEQLLPEDLLLSKSAFIHILKQAPFVVSTSITGEIFPLTWKEVHLERGTQSVLDHIVSLKEEGYDISIFAGSAMLRERIEYALNQRGLRVQPLKRDILRQRGRPAICVLEDAISSGFIIPGLGLAVIAGDEAFGGKKHRKPPKRLPILNPFTQINVGDHVVHRDNGIGIFKGIERIELEGIMSDFVVLEYQDGDKLYVPVYRLGLLQRYVGDADGLIVDKLGGTRWNKAKTRARESTRKLAVELLSIYAKRESAQGFAFDVRNTNIKDFEDDFPYDETEDQLHAIEEMYVDMASRKPMDRLICGDVGYGKTEVALRAAFVAAMSGKQTAVLVPTTLLTRQHLATFRSRFDRWPVRVDAISSLSNSSASKAILDDLRAGQVDIVIGTHALLSDRVQFKDLGLLIVDEEHRFGVKDKEKIKARRTEIDILTLTATPIPRTLNMAISGIRDMSIIETPPVDRKSIETMISRFDDDIIVQAVERELARGGQVFFVHNMVANIDAMADYVQSICSNARVGVAHGQTSRKELERVMEQFLDRRINVLVTSAIIGSGIDIASANTIIINRADKFGLADLYQLRGRVGRSKVKGYTLLLIPAVGQITKDAQKRLSAIKEYELLGAGFQMALRDMEIRGVGEILGHAQWGYVAAIGFELYQQMLKEAVDKLQGKPIVPELDPEIKIELDAYIPDDYCPDQHLRLGLYKRLASATQEDIVKIHDELNDMYGPAPQPVKTLLFIAEIRDTLKALRIRKLEREDSFLRLYFAHDTMVSIDTLIHMVRQSGGRMYPEGIAEIPIGDMYGLRDILRGLSDAHQGKDG